MRSLKLLSFFAFVLLLATGCDTQTSEPDIPAPRALTDAELAVLQADNVFGLRLFNALASAEHEENVFISPLSVSMALGMTLNGAAGTTQSEMRTVLAKEGLTKDEINTAYRDLSTLLTSMDNAVTMQLANSIWYREGFGVDDAFLETNKTYFNAEVSGLDFADPAAPSIINQWVDNHTNGRIQQIVERIPPEAVMYLINATYFKGTWTYQFNADATEDRPFYNEGGTGFSTVPTMNLSGTLPYYQTNLYGALDIPYGNGLFSMTLLLPHPDASLDDMLASFDEESWNALTTGLAEREADLFLPRFTLEYKKTLKETLIDLGMDDAFSAGIADFSGISTAQALFLSEVTHKTFLEVNEEGTEAAAVTSVEVGTTSIDPNAPVRFEVNRPFALALRERHTGAIMFIGRINQL